MEKRLGPPQEYKRRKAEIRLTDSAVLATKLLADLVSARSSEALQDKGHDKESLASYTPETLQKNRAGPGPRRRAVSSMALPQIRVFEE